MLGDRLENHPKMKQKTDVLLDLMSRHDSCDAYGCRLISFVKLACTIVAIVTETVTGQQR